MLSKMCSKFGLSLIVGVVVTSFLWVTLAPAQPEAPDDITIQSKIWPKKKKADVALSHKKHAEEYKIPCLDCHHVYKDGKNVWQQGQEVQKCEACHTCVKQGKALKEASPEEKKLSLLNAFHDNCKNCHKDTNKGKSKEEQTAPTKCTQCHPKAPK